MLSIKDAHSAKKAALMPLFKFVAVNGLSEVEAKVLSALVHFDGTTEDEQRCYPAFVALSKETMRRAKFIEKALLCLQKLGEVPEENPDSGQAMLVAASSPLFHAAPASVSRPDGAIKPPTAKP